MSLSDLALVVSGVLVAICGAIVVNKFKRTPPPPPVIVSSPKEQALAALFPGPIVSIVNEYEGRSVDARTLCAQAKTAREEMVSRCVDYILLECQKKADEGLRFCNVFFFGSIDSDSCWAAILWEGKLNVVKSTDVRFFNLLQEAMNRNRVVKLLKDRGMFQECEYWWGDGHVIACYTCKWG